MIRNRVPTPMPSRASVRRQAHASWVAQTFAGAVSKDHQGRWVEAEQLYKSILVLEANHLGALHNLGYLRLRQGDRDEAARILRKTLRLHPKSAEAHNSLGLVLHTSGQFLEAVACYKTALSLKPDYWMAHNNLGASLHELNRPDQAIPCYQKALTLNPRYADAHGNLGNALQSLGRIDEARRTFEAAIALAPRQASRYHSLSACKRFSAGDPYLAAMEALAAEADKLPEDDRMQLHFALAKALRDVGEHGRSFSHLLTAVSRALAKLPTPSSSRAPPTVLVASQEVDGPSSLPSRAMTAGVTIGRLRQSIGPQSRKP